VKRTVTHYFCREPDPDYWISLYFVTSDSAGRFYFGFETIEVPAAEIERRCETGELSRLETPWQIETGQTLWLTSNRDIWLTKGDDPVEDVQRTLVEQGGVPDYLSKHELLGRRKVRVLYSVPDDRFVRGDAYTEFGDLVAARLAKQLGLKLVKETSSLAKWNMFADLIKRDAIDFTSLAYFLHPRRARDYAVVQFGSLDTYTLYFNAKSRSLKNWDNPLFNSNLTIGERIIEASKINTDLKFGLIPNTAAGEEVLVSLRESKGAFYFAHCCTAFNNEQELETWLSRNKTDGIAIVDHGFAEILDCSSKLHKNKRDVSFEHNKETTNIPFAKPLPVGFVCNREDERWIIEVRKATAGALQEFVFVGDNYSQMNEELRNSTNAHLLAPDELKEMFGISKSNTLRIRDAV